MSVRESKREIKRRQLAEMLKLSILSPEVLSVPMRLHFGGSYRPSFHSSISSSSYLQSNIPMQKEHQKLRIRGMDVDKNMDANVAKVQENVNNLQKKES